MRGRAWEKETALKLAELAKVEGRAANECVGCYAERRLTGQDHIDLIAAYGNSAATSAEISASLIDEFEIDADRKAIARHRRGECAARKRYL